MNSSDRRLVADSRAAITVVTTAVTEDTTVVTKEFLTRDMQLAILIIAGEATVAIMDTALLITMDIMMAIEKTSF